MPKPDSTNLTARHLPIHAIAADAAKQLHGLTDASISKRLKVINKEFRHVYELLRTQNDTVSFFGSAVLPETSEYYIMARELAAKIARELDLTIVSGGGPGIMEAANRGASEAGGKTIGLNISLPFEQKPNPYVTRELSFEFRYFFMRKLWFAHLARALVVFPGGFGTLDELTELLTLEQTRKLDPPIRILLYGTSYWKEILNFDALVRHGMISAEDLALFVFVDDPTEAVLLLQAWLTAEPAHPAPAFAASHPDRSSG